MAEVKAGSKELRALVRRFKPGYHIVADGKAKVIIIGPDGNPVRRQDGRHLGLPNSPHPSSITEHIHRLRENGVLLEDTGKPERERDHLVRDDLFGIVSHENNHETNRLRADLQALGLKPRDARAADDLAKVTSHVSGLQEWLCLELVARLFDGQTLTDSDREPFTQLLALLETEEEPIPAFFKLLRRAKGLPIEEETIDTLGLLPEQTQHQPQEGQDMELEEMVATTGVSTIEEMVTQFISTLTERETMLMDEANKTRDLIVQLQEQYGIENQDDGTVGVRVEAPEPRQQPRPRVTRIGPAESENGGAGRHSEGGFGPKNPFTVQHLMGLIGEGGEWTPREISQHFGINETTARASLKNAVEEGLVVVVTPGKMGGPRGYQTSYGASEIYNS